MQKLACLVCLLLALICWQVPIAAEDEGELSDAEREALSVAAYSLLRDHCWHCHGEPGREAFGRNSELDWILDYDKLIEHSVVAPGSARNSRLVRITLLGDMPRAFDDQDSPSIRANLSTDDVQVFIDWINAGAPRWPEPKFEHEWRLLADGPHVRDGVAVSSSGGFALFRGEHIYSLQEGRWRQTGTNPVAISAASSDGTLLAAQGGEEARLYHWREEIVAASIPAAPVLNVRHVVATPGGAFVVGDKALLYAEGWSEVALPQGTLLAAGYAERLLLLMGVEGGVQTYERHEDEFRAVGEALKVEGDAVAAWDVNRAEFVIATGGKLHRGLAEFTVAKSGIRVPETLGGLVGGGGEFLYDRRTGHTRVLTPWRK